MPPIFQQIFVSALFQWPKILFLFNKNQHELYSVHKWHALYAKHLFKKQIVVIIWLEHVRQHKIHPLIFRRWYDPTNLFIQISLFLCLFTSSWLSNAHYRGKRWAQCVFVFASQHWYEPRFAIHIELAKK